jgi:hypothetical protein
VAVEPKMERKEISTTAAGFDFAIEFRQLLADFVAKVESCRATIFSRKHETESDHRFV